MKKNIFLVFLVFAIFFLVSCASAEDEGSEDPNLFKILQDRFYEITGFDRTGSSSFYYQLTEGLIRDSEKDIIKNTKRMTLVINGEEVLMFNRTNLNFKGDGTIDFGADQKIESPKFFCDPQKDTSKVQQRTNFYNANGVQIGKSTEVGITCQNGEHAIEIGGNILPP